MTGVSGTEGYEAEADRLAEMYESVDFDQSIHLIRDFLPPPGSSVLDIGAGTGRDAAGFHRLGYRVTAVEPTAALRAHGMRLHAAAAITWIDDALPDLIESRRLGRRYEFILLRAVWMHLDARQRETAMPNLGALAAPSGLLFLTLRYGPVPPGRRMFTVTAEETRDLAARAGFDIVFEERHGDSFGREGVRWTSLLFRKSG